MHFTSKIKDNFVLYLLIILFEEFDTFGRYNRIRFVILGVRDRSYILPEFGTIKSIRKETFLLFLNVENGWKFGQCSRYKSARINKSDAVVDVCTHDLVSFEEGCFVDMFVHSNNER